MLLAVFTVTSPDDLGPGSLRQAVLDANGTAEANTIAFAIGGGGVQTIQLNSDLPTVTRPATVDGTTQPGYAGTPLIELLGRSYGLRITGGGSVVRGLAINSATQAAISLEGVGNNVITGNFIGTDATGLVGVGSATGIFINSTPDNTIGGATPGAGNLISGNTNYGIASDFGVLVQGTSSARTLPVPPRWATEWVFSANRCKSAD